MAVQTITHEQVLRINYFARLTEQQAAKVARIVQPWSVPAGDDIINDGESGDSMYLLLQGQVEVSKNLFVKGSDGFHQARKAMVRLESKEPPASEAPINPSTVLTIPGFFAFGEMALFDENSKRSATVTATTPCELGVIKNADFVALAESDTDLGFRVFMNIAKKLSEDLNRANQDVLNLTTAFSFALQR
ncbi:MAG TPA: cyclic nucleotide-binding domain-containing protein [Chloroflexota bacterium]|jgi:CRP-like cAMP-binding protein|nr:cyclic nucleotide-binding domain-containing protein [Chloroflexota bacterium]